MRHLFKHPAIHASLAWVLTHALVLLLRSIRWEIAQDATLTALVSGPAHIIALWHEALPCGPPLWLKVGELGMTRPTAILASRNADGQLVGRIMRRLGTELVSGSSSKGGREALEALVESVNNGRHIILTPDGPRGPRRQPHPGVAKLASRTGAAVVPMGTASHPSITLKSWDSMRVPLPFGRGVIRLGTPIPVPAGEWEAALPAIGAAITKMQDEALARCLA